MSVATKRSKTLRVLPSLLMGNTSDGIIFKGQFKSAQNKMLWKLTWGFAKFLFQRKTKTKFPAMKKNVLLGYLPNEPFWIFFHVASLCFSM